MNTKTLMGTGDGAMMLGILTNIVRMLWAKIPGPALTLRSVSFVYYK